MMSSQITDHGHSSTCPTSYKLLQHPLLFVSWTAHLSLLCTQPTPWNTTAAHCSKQQSLHTTHLCDMLVAGAPNSHPLNPDPPPYWLLALTVLLKSTRTFPASEVGGGVWWVVSTSSSSS